MTEQSPVSILIVEDDPSIRNMLCTFFTDQKMTVNSSPDGKDIPELVASLGPDIILLDVVLPYNDGFSILKMLRNGGNDTPVIMLTDKGQVDDKVTGLELGADDYMTKPFSPRELLARVKAQLRRLSKEKSGERPSTVTVGQYSIDPGSREVLLAGRQPVRLTKTEFDLLYYLAVRLEVVITHGELLQEVLGYDPEVETKSLVMHIANVRRKLEKVLPGSLEIKAVPGVGYKLLAH